MIAASLVKELRERSGAGFMDCKNALNETNGNIEKAIEFLRKSGAAKAQKKAGRSTKEGAVEINVDNGFPAIWGQIRRWAIEISRRVIDQDVDTAEPFNA